MDADVTTNLNSVVDRTSFYTNALKSGRGLPVDDV